MRAEKSLIAIFFILIGVIPLLSMQIDRMEPAFWWTDMQNSELQIMVYGENIAQSNVEMEYPGVLLKEVVRLENPNYLFLYLDISKNSKPGILEFVFTEGGEKTVRPYELKARENSVGAQGFDASDVMYLIMPDRFANGDPSSDVWVGVVIDREDPFGRLGGDFAGILQNLDYLEELGITTVWLNPDLENRMPQGPYHGYTTTDYYKVDSWFGSNEDYLQLVDALHQKGMKIVMDMIYNHCGSHHWWMEDLPASDWLNHQEGFSPTSHDLYTVMDPYAPESEKERLVDGWFVPSMPDLNQRNPHLATYLIQNSIWWIEYARLDGIRHDTHPYADFDFLSRWTREVMEEYPDFNIVGESWYIHPGPLAWWQQNSELNEEKTHLKSVMDFSLMNAAATAFPSGPNTGRNPLRAIYEIIAQDFLYPDPGNLLVFLDNHDTSRFRKKEEKNLDRYKQALTFLLTTRGIPQIYYGTELLMTGEKEEGDGNLRKDVPGGWPGDEENQFERTGRNEMQNEAWDFLRKILQWRKNSQPIIHGNLIHYAPDHQYECYVYARRYEDETVLIILNGSEKEQALPVERYAEVIDGFSSGKDVISGQEIDLSRDIVVKPKGVFILELDK